MEACVEWILSFLTRKELIQLRGVCRIWHFTCCWLQNPSIQPKKSIYNLKARKFRSSWQSFYRQHADKIRNDTIPRLPESEKKATNSLKRKLCESTNTGERPSFSNEQARSGYVQTKFNRCVNIPNLLLTEVLSDIRSKLFQLQRIYLAMYGGGPGFDAIGLVILREYIRSRIPIHATVFDNEIGWQNVVNGLRDSLSSLLYENISLSFELCDITTEITAEPNAPVKAAIIGTNLFVFSFVCVENYQLLNQHKFAFFKTIFEQAEIGSYFIFTDSTHRLWPEIWRVALDTRQPFRIWTPFVRSCHYALVLEKLQKKDDPSRYAHYQEAMKNISIFTKHMEYQTKSSSSNERLRICIKPTH
jgi:hypothetical protein